MDRLRDPVDGCPWDNAQTHKSLRPHLLEETYEVLEAIAAGDPAELCEELGDLMMQVVLHAKLAEQAGAFTLDDVSESIRAKLVRRHPHVFGDGTANTPKLVEGAWERLKARERPNRESVLDGVPKTLPALARAQSILGRAERNGFAREADDSLELGQRLLDLVQEARDADLSAEDALRDALIDFERDVRRQEAEQRAEA
ncbi:MAG: MazG family protein [Chloroflexi bacterium]|nr:MazG family protein [Chloroflexota bacterium]